MRGFAYILGGKFYDLLDGYFERTRYEKVRRKILSGLKGKILDAGCGTGRNFHHYPKSSYVLAVDNSEPMLNAARERANNLSNIEIKHADITRLDLPDNSVNAVVATFVLCTMPAKLERLALNELVRVANPGARLYFLEYVYSHNFIRRLIMMLTSFIPKALYGIRFNSTMPIINEEPRLTIEKTEFVHDDVLRLIVARKK